MSRLQQTLNFHLSSHLYARSCATPFDIFQAMFQAARVFTFAKPLSRTNWFAFKHAAVRHPSNRDSCEKSLRTLTSMVEVYIVFKTYSIFLMPCFTGMRDGAGSAGFTGSGGGGAGLSLVMIASRW